MCRKSFTRTKMISKVQKAFAEDFTASNGLGIKTIDEVFLKLETMDPDTKCRNFRWITNWYANGDFRLEDADRVTAALEGFSKYKVKLDVRDVGMYATFNDLESAVDSVRGNDVTTNGERIRNMKRGGSNKLVSTKNFQIIELLDSDAAKYYGKGTKWCTTGSMYENYASTGRLYVMILNVDGTQRKWQFHFESSQFMDETDRPVNAADIKLLSAQPEYMNFLNKMAEKHFKTV